LKGAFAESASPVSATEFFRTNITLLPPCKTVKKYSFAHKYPVIKGVLHAI